MEKKLIDGKLYNENGELVNQKGDRINSNGEEVIEIDVEQFMRALKHTQIGHTFAALGCLVLMLYVMSIGGSGEYMSIREHSVYVILAVVLFIISMILNKTKWQPKNIQDAKVVVKLPKSVLKSFETADGVSDLIAHKDYEKLDVDGDGNLLVSEFYTMSEDDVEKEIKEIDEKFSIESFKSFAKSVFVVVQNAWSENDFKMLRPFQTDTLYYRQKLRIEDMIDDNFVNKRTHIRVKGVLLKDFRIEGDYEILVVMMTANMKVTHPSTIHATENGDVPYVLKFMRKKGVKSINSTELSTSNCSNCGAVIDVDDKGVCKYCNTSLVSGEHDWVLSDIRNIKLQGM